MSAGREAWTLRRLLQKVRHVLHHQRSASVAPDGQPKGRVLVSYIHEPFLRGAGELPRTHVHYWRTYEIVRIFLELGYAVDVISYHNRTFRPRHEYVLFTDPRWNLERLSDRLNDDCLRVMMIDTANMTFQNAAETRRLLDLQERRGFTLRPRRFEYPNHGIEYADCATIVGNDVTMSTYRYAGKPLLPVPVNPAVAMDHIPDRNLGAVRNRFLWFGSGGMVHKGLDLVLEVFARNPDLELVVVGPVEREADFVHAYRRELYDLPNIETMGWMDVSGARFRQVLGSVVGMVYPSCSEGQSGTAALTMHAGVIPICSRESGLDIEPDVGIMLDDCSLEAIEDAVRSVAGRSDANLAAMSEQAHRYAATHHSAEAFVSRYRSLAEDLLADPASYRSRPLGPRTSATSPAGSPPG